jgi:hypothetical protein
MKHFINLTTSVINKLHIIEIVKKPSKYTIFLSNNDISGCILVGSGSVSTTSNKIDICEKDDKVDYDKITELIKQIE